jgi:hypothetical protein
MPSAIQTSHDAVLSAYAQAQSRAEKFLTTTQLRYEAPLLAAREALKAAEADELKVINRTYDSSCIKAYRAYESEMRSAGNTHGRAMTACVTALNERRSAIQSRREEALAPFKRQLEEVTNSSPGSALSRLPYLDALESAAVEADSIAAQEEEQAYALYLQEKHEKDCTLAQTVERLLGERQDASTQALSVLERDKRTLLEPLQTALQAAQQELDQAMSDAHRQCQVWRLARLAIIKALRDGTYKSSQAIAALEALH